MRKYIDDLNIKEENRPEGYNPNDKRQDSWRKEREIYGFDERDTWDLNYTMNLMLYERLCYFNEFAPINKEHHKIEFKGKEITLQECLDRMIEGLKLDLIIDFLDKKRREDKEIINKIDEWAFIYAECRYLLWW